MTEQAAERIYDERADDYGYRTDASTTERLKVELTRRYVTPQARVLDVGSANGVHLRLVAPLCAHATGIDVSPRMIEIARERLAADGVANVDLVQASADDLPFDDASFDLVYSFSTLLLVPNLSQALDEIRRVLVPGGVALLDLAGRWNLSQRHWRRWYREQGHFGVHAMSRRQLDRALASRGLEIAEIHALGVTDQWRYVRGSHRLERLDTVFHGSGDRDRDYRVSNLPGLRRMANRWFVAARRL
jgi:ubiquinone/menaquinone biosynthesis C-methylase UbiE